MTPPAAAAAPAVRRGRSVAPPRPAVAPRRPRRISGPARPPARRPARPVQRPAQAERGLVLGLLAAVSRLSRHRALDRLIRGRIWIALITFALIGIVTLQLLVLQLNASIGRALVRQAQLQRENAALSIESSELAAGERVESQAVRLGMELVPVGALRFLAVDPPADIARAAAALSTPVRTPGGGAAPGSGEAGGGAAPGSGEAGAGASSATASATATAASAEQAAGSTATAPPGEATASPPASSGAAASGAAEAAPVTEAPPAGAAGGTQANGAG